MMVISSCYIIMILYSQFITMSVLSKTSSNISKSTIKYSKNIYLNIMSPRNYNLIIYIQERKLGKHFLVCL